MHIMEILPAAKQKNPISPGVRIRPIWARNTARQVLNTK